MWRTRCWATGGRLDPIELRRLRSALRHIALRQAQEPGADPAPSGRELLLSAMQQPLEFDLIDTREARRAAVVARTLAVLRDELDRGATAHELLWTAWDRSGLERAWSELARGSGPLADQANRDLDAVVALFQAAKRFVERSLDADPRVFVRGILDSDVAEDRLDAPAGGDAVRILTPAGALGTEFDTVVIAGVQDGVWPNTRLRGITAGHVATGGCRSPRRRRGRVRRSIGAVRRCTTSCGCSRARCRAPPIGSSSPPWTTTTPGPSVFFEFLPDPERHTVEHPLSLRGLVAQHRRALTDPSARGDARAEPRSSSLCWPMPGFRALRRPSGSACPRRPPPGRCAISRVRTCGSRRRACTRSRSASSTGSSATSAATRAARRRGSARSSTRRSSIPTGSDEASLWAEVESRWGELTFEAEWRDRGRADPRRDLVRRLHLYLRRFEQAGGALIGAEPHFEVAIPLGGCRGVRARRDPRRATSTASSSRPRARS